jgi:hypothetical protein
MKEIPKDRLVNIWSEAAPLTEKLRQADAAGHTAGSLDFAKNSFFGHNLSVALVKDIVSTLFGRSKIDRRKVGARTDRSCIALLP